MGPCCRGRLGRCVCRRRDRWRIRHTTERRATEKSRRRSTKNAGEPWRGFRGQQQSAAARAFLSEIAHPRRAVRRLCRPRRKRASLEVSRKRMPATPGQQTLRSRRSKSHWRFLRPVLPVPRPPAISARRLRRRTYGAAPPPPLRRAPLPTRWIATVPAGTPVMPARVGPAVTLAFGAVMALGGPRR